MNVLIIDRELFLAELVKLALEADGHDCVTVASFDEASEIVRSVRPDLIALDLDASGSSLHWLDGTVLAHPELHGRLFVLADRALQHDEASRLVACGARVIRKPFTIQQVRETVRLMTPAEVRPRESRPRGPAMEA